MTSSTTLTAPFLFSFLFINQQTNITEFKKQINIPPQQDDFNDIRTEYSDMLQAQLTKGNNGLLKRKYITFGIEADSLRAAKAKLERIEADILNNFKSLGVKTEPLSGYERLKVLHDVFNMDTKEPFRFSFDMVARTGLSTKDFIAPTSFDFREGKYFKMGKTIGAVSFLQILAPELNDRMLSDFLDMDSNITVNFHIRTIDQAQAIKRIKMKITDLDKMKIEEQKKAVRSGYDMEIIPSDLATFGGEAKAAFAGPSDAQRTYLPRYHHSDEHRLVPGRSLRTPSFRRPPLPRSITVRSSGWTSSRRTA